MNTIGKIIKEARLNKGLTQEKLATKVGVQKSAIAKWENGRVTEIKRSNLKALAIALGLNPNTLLSPSSKEDEDYYISFCEPCLVREDKMLYDVQNEKISNNRVDSSLTSFQLSEQETHMIVLFRSLNEYGQNKVLSYIDDLSGMEKYAACEKL